MSEFLSCYIWWLILGILIGFFLFWLYDKLFRRDGENLLAQNEEELTRLRSQNKAALDDLNAMNRKIADVKKSEDDIGAAAKFGFSPFKNGKDNLTVIEGIGPKISLLLNNRGIEAFVTLAKSDVQSIQNILDDSGSAFKLAKPESWPKQAQMCVDRRWEELKAYQDRLVNGIEFDN